MTSDICSLPRSPTGVGQGRVVQLQRRLSERDADTHCDNTELIINQCV